MRRAGLIAAVIVLLLLGAGCGGEQTKSKPASAGNSSGQPSKSKPSEGS
jgi:hypothetical protein